MVKAWNFQGLLLCANNPLLKGTVEMLPPEQRVNSMANPYAR